MKIRFLLSAAVSLSLTTGGCGMQMPVSEGLVFSSSQPYGQQNEEILPFLRTSAAVTLVSALPAHSLLQDAAVSDHGSAEAKFLNRKLMTIFMNPGFGFSFGSGRRLAVAVSPGLVITGFHVDGTVQTVEKVFFTVNKRFLIENGTELIMQRPVWEKNGGGFSLGAFYRSEPMQYVRNDDLLLSRGEPPFYVQWYGLRLMGQTPDFPGGNLHVRGFINAGYAGGYRVPMVAAGVSIAVN